MSFFFLRPFLSSRPRATAKRSKGGGGSKPFFCRILPPYLVTGRGADRHGAAHDARGHGGRTAGARERGGAEGGGGGEGHGSFEFGFFFVSCLKGTTDERE